MATQRSFRLDSKHVEVLDAVTVRLSARLGDLCTRSDALRVILNAAAKLESFGVCVENVLADRVEVAETGANRCAVKRRR